MPPSRRAAGTRPAPGGTGAHGSWGGRRIPRHHLSPHRSRPRASCRYHKPMGSHQSTPPSAHQSPASRTASASTHYRRPANTSKAQCTRCRFTLPTLEQRFHFMASVMKNPGKFLPKIKNTCAGFHSRLSAHMGLHFYYVISSKAGLWLLLHCQLDWFKAQTD